MRGNLERSLRKFAGIIGDHVVARSTTFADGIVTSMHGQAAFNAALSGLTFADDSEKALLPYGMVIQNDGPFTVVAYCLQWVFDDGDGAPIIEEKSRLQPLALDDGDKRSHLRFDGDNVLDPGGSCLITPAENYPLKPESSVVSPSAAGRAHAAQRELSALAENNATKPFSQVRLAAYVLSDGSCVEAHQSSLRESLQASVDGMQDVLQAADQQAFDGNVADFLASVSAATTRPTFNNPADLPYTAFQSIWLDFVKSNMKSIGYEPTMEQVRQRLYKHHPTIKAR
jgi:hypothetical protein